MPLIISVRGCSSCELFLSCLKIIRWQNTFQANNGAFHSMNNSGLNVLTFPETNGIELSKISEKGDNLARSLKFITANSHSNFLKEFLNFSVEGFAFRKFNLNYPDCLETFLGYCPYHLFPIRKAPKNEFSSTTLN